MFDGECVTHLRRVSYSFMVLFFFVREDRELIFQVE